MMPLHLPNITIVLPVTRRLLSILWEVAETKPAEIRECNLAQNYRNDQISVLVNLEKLAVKFYNLYYYPTFA
jgi:hypothetical protein